MIRERLNDQALFRSLNSSSEAAFISCCKVVSQLEKTKY